MKRYLLPFVGACLAATTTTILAGQDQTAFIKAERANQLAQQAKDAQEKQQAAAKPKAVEQKSNPAEHASPPATPKTEN
jgi:hypothetical protein